MARKAEKVTFSWDDDEDNKPLEVGTVRPIYISDAKNKKTQETGKTWAGTSIKTERKNDPFQLHILNLEHRSKGGRAYKCVDLHNNYFDMREDVLMDTIRHCTITNGVPEAEFVWGKVKSEMKVVRVGSDLYNALIGANVMDATKVVNIKDIKVGDKMQAKNGEVAVFLGFVNAQEAKVVYEKVAAGYPVGSYMKDGEWQRVESIDDVKGVQLWFEVPDYEKGRTVAQIFSKKSDGYGLRFYYLKFKKSHSYKVKLGSEVIAPDFIETMRQAAVKETVTGKEGREYRLHTAASNLKYNTMRLVSDPAPTLPEKALIRVGSRWNIYGRGQDQF